MRDSRNLEGYTLRRTGKKREQRGAEVSKARDSLPPAEMLVADGLLDAAREIDAEDLHSYLQVFQMFNRDHTPLLEATVRSEVNSELKFSPNFEGLVLGCIDADFCK